MDGRWYWVQYKEVMLTLIQKMFISLRRKDERQQTPGDYRHGKLICLYIKTPLNTPITIAYNEWVSLDPCNFFLLQTTKPLQQCQSKFINICNSSPRLMTLMTRGDIAQSSLEVHSMAVASSLNFFCLCHSIITPHLLP
jgi:hypothetical protein